MHAAPPVRVSLGRSFGWVALQVLCATSAVTNLAAWWLLRMEQDAAWAAMPGLAAAVLAAAWAWRDQVPCDLAWDGAVWHWADAEGDMRVMLDLDAWMLLRFAPAAGRRRWIAASRRSAQGSWAALRAALYSPRPADPLGPARQP